MARGNVQKTEKLCPVCNKTFVGAHDQKYCGKQCRHKHSNTLRARYAPEERACKYCGDKFLAKVKFKVFCSKKCCSRYNEAVPLAEAARADADKRQHGLIFGPLIAKKGHQPSITDYQVFAETVDKKIVVLTPLAPVKEATVEYRKIKEEVYATNSKGEYIGKYVNCWLCQAAKSCPHRSMLGGKTCVEAANG